MYPNQNQQPTYEADYLDKIAPGPEKQKFLSGSFGKIFIAMVVLFLVAIGIIINMQGADKTGSTVKIFLAVETLEKVVNKNELNFKSGSLEESNVNFKGWLANAKQESSDLLKRAGVLRSKYNKEDVAAAKSLEADLNKKLEEAFFSDVFDDAYAREMAYQLAALSSQFTALAAKPPGAPFKEFATKANANLEPIHNAFKNFDSSND